MKLHYVLLVCILLLIGACSQGDPLPAQDEKTQTAAESDDVPSADDARNEARSLFRKKPVVYKVVQEMETESDGVTSTVEYTLYLKGDKMRMDVTGSEADGQSYLIGDTAYICSKSEGSWECMKASSDQFSPPQSYDYYDYINDPELDFDRDGTITVSGHTAKCYSWRYEVYSSKVCISEEGYPLYSKMVGEDGTYEYKVKSYSTDVPDTEFDLPKGAKIIDLNAMQEEMLASMGVENMEELCIQQCDSFEGAEKDECLANC